MSPLRTFLVSLALALPLIGGAIYVAASGSDVSQTWNNSSDTASGAPAAGGTGGIPPESLVGARRAAGEAGTQSGFLVTGTGELVAGVDKLTGSANDMTGATKELANGTQQLADGMTQIQAGTGQLGSAASQVADGVDQAVEQVQGVIALQPQLLAAIDDADRKLAANPAPDAADARKQLADFRSQVAGFKLGGGTVDQLAQLRSGSRDIANQLTQPGSQYHDAIYTATDGSKQLSSRMQEYATGVDAALASVGELHNGVQRIDGMAKATQDKTTAMQRALPAVTQVQPAENTDSEPEKTSSLPPMYAFLIAALVSAAGVAYVWSTGGGRNWLNLLGVSGGLALVGSVLFALLANGLGVGSALLGVLTLCATAGVSVFGSSALLSLLGERWGRIALAVGSIAQVGVVGWVWKTSAAAETASWAQAISALMPLHYPTSALTTIGNAGSGSALAVALIVMLLLGVGGGVVVRRSV